MSNIGHVWHVDSAHGTIGFVRAGGADLPDGAELIDPHLAALFVPSWFPPGEPSRERVDLLTELCAEGAGMVSLDAPRELDLLRARVAEMLESQCLLAFRRS